MDLPAEGSTAAPAQTLTASCGMRPSKYCMGHTIHTSASDASCLLSTDVPDEPPNLSAALFLQKGLCVRRYLKSVADVLRL
jgi:hypothetical protein